MIQVVPLPLKHPPICPAGIFVNSILFSNSQPLRWWEFDWQFLTMYNSCATSPNQAGCLHDLTIEVSDVHLCTQVVNICFALQSRNGIVFEILLNLFCFVFQGYRTDFGGKPRRSENGARVILGIDEQSFIAIDYNVVIRSSSERRHRRQIRLTYVCCFGWPRISSSPK